MTTAQRTAQQAEDLMILKAGAVQLAQVQFNNSKVEDEAKLSLYFLHEFKHSLESIQRQQKKYDEENKWLNVLKTVLTVVAYVVAVAAFLCGQPAIGILILAATTASLIKSTKKDKNGNRLSLMGALTSDIASRLPGGDNPKNQTIASIIIAASSALLTCGTGAVVSGITSAESFGSVALSSLMGTLPLGFLTALGGTEFLQGVISMIGAAHLPPVLKVFLIILVVVAFLLLMWKAAAKVAGAAIEDAANTVLGKLKAALQWFLNLISKEKSVIRPTVLESSEAVEGPPDWNFDAEEEEAVARIAAQEETEMQSIAQSGFSGVAPEAPGGVDRLSTVLTALRNIQIASMGIETAGNVTQGGIEVDQRNKLRDPKDGLSVLHQENTAIEFQIQLINMLADQDSKILKTQWQADAATQQAYSQFAADAGAVADALLA